MAPLNPAPLNPFGRNDNPIEQNSKDRLFDISEDKN